MKKLIALTLLILPFAGFSQQGLLNKLKYKAKERGEQLNYWNVNQGVQRPGLSGGRSCGKRSDPYTGVAQNRTSNLSESCMQGNILYRRK